jgi:hypothetical protein
MSEPHTVTEPKSYVFLVLDGRANTDPDEAQVLRVLQEVSFERSYSKFIKEFNGTDACLFAVPAKGKMLLPGQIHIRSRKDLELL